MPDWKMCSSIPAGKFLSGKPVWKQIVTVRVNGSCIRKLVYYGSVDKYS